MIRNIAFEGKSVRIEEVCYDYFKYICAWRNNLDNKIFFHKILSLILR